MYGKKLKKRWKVDQSVKLLQSKKYEIFAACNGIGVTVIEKGKIPKMKRKNELNVCYHLLVGLVKGKEKEF